MGNKIVINDGLKTFDIVNQDGKLLGQFSFNPSDTNIIHRYNDVVKSLEEFAKEVDKKEDAEIETLLNEVEPVIFGKINELLNADVAESFFSIMGPFSPLESGQYFIESVIDAIGQAIQAETGERVKKMNGKIKKHTSKYHG